MQDAESYFSDALLDRFDIVSWDPRVSGEAPRSSAANKLDYFFDTDKSPDDAAEVAENVAGRAQARQRVRERSAALSAPRRPTRRSTTWTRSAPRSARRSSPISASRTARISARVYADQLSRPCARARARRRARSVARLRGRHARDQAEGFDSALDAFFDYCRRERSAASGAAIRAAPTIALIAQIDAEPVPGEVGGEQRTLGPGEFDLGVASALYPGKPGWSVLADALAAARGDGTTLLAALRRVHERKPGGTYDNSTAAFFGIGCLDAPCADDRTAGCGRAADRTGRAGVRRVDHVVVVAVLVWPVPADGHPRRCTAKGAPPIVVVGTTNDPATPFKWAQALADQLESGHLIMTEARVTPRYGRGNDCIDNAVDDYLVTLKVPPDGLAASRRGRG